MTEDNTLALATPTRFLLESGEWNITPTIRNSMAEEINPFEYNFQERGLMQHTKPVEPPTLSTRSAISDFTVYTSSEEEETKTSSATSPSTPPMSVSQSPSNSSASSPISKTESQLVQPIESTNDTITTVKSSMPTNVRRSTRTHTKPQLFNEIDNNNEHEFKINNQHQQQSRSSQSGRKRRIVFEGDDAEDRRKKFLERNRIAAYKCRQKKKNWMQELEQRADMANNQNEELRSIVAQLKEESMYLRNMLLTHGNCDCDTVQAYLRKTSAQLTASAENSQSPVLPFSYPPSRRDSTMSTATSYTMPPPPPPPILRDSVQSFHSSFSSYPEQSTGLTPFLNTVINKSEVGDYFS